MTANDPALSTRADVEAVQFTDAEWDLIGEVVVSSRMDDKRIDKALLEAASLIGRIVQGRAAALSTPPAEDTPSGGETVTEWGVRWGKVEGRAREVGQIEHYGMRPGGDIGPFSEGDARYIAGSEQTVVSRQRTRYPDRVTDWQEVTP